MYRMKKMAAAVLALILCFTLTIGAAYASLNDVKGKISDKKQQLQQGEEKEQQIQGEINQLTKKVDTLQGDIDQLQVEINSTEIQISQKETELKEIKDDIDAQSEGLNARLRVMYMNDNTSFVEVLINSGSISELLTNLDLIKRIHKSDKEVLADLEKQHEKVEAAKKELDRLEASLETQQGEIRGRQDELQEDKDTLTAKKKKVQSANDKLEGEIEELQKEADAITAQIKAREAEQRRKQQQQQGGGGNTGGSGQLGWPCSGHVSCEYGNRYCPFHGYELHTGMDISVPSGTAIHAAASGTVVQAYYNNSYGNMVLIDHGNGIYTLYAHNSSLCVSAGASVSKGQTIAYSGSTGDSTGPHCHFEVRVNGQYVNPRNYL